MKANELIETLEEMVKEHGDREVTILADGFMAGSTGIVYEASDGEDIILETR